MGVTYTSKSPHIDAIRKELEQFKERMAFHYRAYELYRAKVQANETYLKTSETDPETFALSAEPQSHIAKVTVTPSGRAPRGLVYKQVDEIMQGGGSFTMPMMKNELRKRYGHEYGISSVHRALAKGVAEKKYKLESGEWTKA